VHISEVIKRRRAELGLSQAKLARAAGVSLRQLTRYEAGQQQPALAAAVDLARALAISLAQLAGKVPYNLDLSGDWWACWQSWKGGQVTLTYYTASVRQRGEHITINGLRANQVVAALTGPPSTGPGALLVNEPQGTGEDWRGELRLCDLTLVGSYTGNWSDEYAPVQPTGTLFFALMQNGASATGRWVGLSHKGLIISGWGTLARSKDQAVALMDELLPQPQITVT